MLHSDIKWGSKVLDRETQAKADLKMSNLNEVTQSKLLLKLLSPQALKTLLSCNKKITIKTLRHSFLKWKLNEQSHIKLACLSSKLRRLRNLRKIQPLQWTCSWFFSVINSLWLHHWLMIGILRLTFCINSQHEYEFMWANFLKFFMKSSIRTWIFSKLISTYSSTNEKSIFEWTKAKKSQNSSLLLITWFTLEVQLIPPHWKIHHRNSNLLIKRNSLKKDFKWKVEALIRRILHKCNSNQKIWHTNQRNLTQVLQNEMKWKNCCLLKLHEKIWFIRLNKKFFYKNLVKTSTQRWNHLMDFKITK